jgi:hypothetical protein
LRYIVSTDTAENCLSRSQNTLSIQTTVLKGFIYIKQVFLGDLVVSYLPLDPRFTGSNLAKDDILRLMKIRSMTSFGGDVKLSAPCKIIRTLQSMMDALPADKSGSMGLEYYMIHGS